MANVLLIDDDADLVDLNRAVLTSRGHQVQSAFSAAEARALLERGCPDIVILDVMMESLDAGFLLAREIHERFPRLPTVILSGVTAATGEPFRFEPDETWLPVLKFLDKPVDPAALAAEIERILA